MIHGIYCEVRIAKVDSEKRIVYMETTIDDIDITGRSPWEEYFFMDDIEGFGDGDLTPGNLIDIEIYEQKVNGFGKRKIRKC